jgi:hypothetical protein
MRKLKFMVKKELFPPIAALNSSQDSPAPHRNTAAWTVGKIMFWMLWILRL